MKEENEMIVLRKDENWKDWKWLFSVLTYEPDKGFICHTNHVQVKNGVAYATDGYRMHALLLNEKTNIEDGIYRVAYTKSDFVLVLNPAAKFPEPTSVWPDQRLVKEEFSVAGDINVVLAKLVRTMPNPMNVSYVLKAIGLNGKGGGGVDTDVFIYGENQPVAFAKYNRMALVMPMRG